MTTTTSAIELRVSPDLVLPTSTVTSVLIVYGARGMGKTNLGAVLAEEFNRVGLRFAVLDPIGNWWGLQHSASGRGPGIEVLVLGGPHGDIPIDPTAGAAVADLVADEDVDVVIDISRHATGKMWTMGEKVRFVTAYTNRLFERQGERMRPRHQIFEEAGRFIPQVIPKGAVQLAECIGAIEQFVEWGRNIGLGCTLITQRSARMQKSVSELADAMIAFRTVGPLSIEAILDWFGEHIARERWKELEALIRTLEVGTALIASPGWLQYEGVARIRARETFDSSATPGAVPRIATAAAAKPNLANYRELLAVTIEKARQDDPRVLHERIRTLEAQLARSATAPGRKLELKEAELETARWEIAELRAQQQVRVEIVPTEHLQWLTEARQRLESAAIDLANQATELAGIIRAAEQRNAAAPEPVAMVPFDGHGPIHARTGNGAPPPAVDAERDPVLRVPEPNGVALSGPQQRILDVLATLHHLGLKAAARIQVAAFSGYADPTTRRFREAVTALERDGLISFPGGGMLALTDRGRKNALATAPISKLEDLHQAWYDRLKGPRDRILRILVEVYPNEITRDALAERAGYSDATTRRFREAVTSLESLGLAWYPYGGSVAATDVLFPPELITHPLVGKAAVVFPKRKPGARARR